MAKRGRPPGSIEDPALKRSRQNLAFMLRENFHEQLVFDWIMMILSGKAPVIVKDNRCKATGGYNVIPDPADMMAPTAERRDQAMKMLLDRRDGLPAQRVQLEAELRTSHVQTVVDARALASLPADKLGMLVATLRNALAAPAPELPAPAVEAFSDVLEAEFTETTE